MGRKEPWNLEGGFEGLRVGLLSPAIWNLPETVTVYPGETKQVMEKVFWAAVAKMKQRGAEAKDIDLQLPWDAFKFSEADFPVSGEHKEPVSQPPVVKEETETSENDGDGNVGEQKSLFQETCMHHLRTTRMPVFLSSFKTSEIRSLEDMIAWNEAHGDVALPPSHPSQHELVELLENNTTPAQAEAMAREFRKRAKDALDPIFQCVDVLVALGDSPLCTYAAGAGYPIATAPLDTIHYSEKNERPFGLCFVAKAGGEETLLRFMEGCEQAFEPRPLPKLLLNSRV
nr:hypothetical protein B0A51_04415 [Rachicladosporium sp. CCFEE 5018]